MANPNFATMEANTINSLTLPLISQKISDNITGKIPFFYLMNKVGRKESDNGGLEYRFPVFKELATAQAYTGLTALTNLERDLVSSAVLYRKQFSLDITLSGTKLLQNSGDDPTAVVNYIAAQIEMAEEGMKNTLAGSSLGIFSSQGDSDLGITGLKAMLPETYTAGTYAGLDRATYSYWRSKYNSVATGFNTDGLISMRTLQLDCVRGDEAPSVIIMTAAGYANLWRSLVGTVSFDTTQPIPQFGDLAFPHINWAGSIVIIDDGMTANQAFFLNLKYLKLLVHRDRDMAIRDFITPVGEDSITGRMYWAGNLVCNNLARQGILCGTIETW